MAAVSAIWSRKFMNFGILNMAHSPPKKRATDEPKDLQTISLVHSFAKELLNY